MLVHDDIDEFFWFGTPESDALAARNILLKLEDRIFEREDLRAANILYAIATEAARGVLNLYLRRPRLFKEITPQRKFLPALFSIHPKTAEVTAQMLKDARLGSQTDDAIHAGSRAYFINDSAANVYARAIISTVRCNRECASVESQQASWADFDRKERVKTVMLPLPDYVAGLDQLPEQITAESVMAYWRQGKEIILEELPDFHLRPEWKGYHKRTYKDGAKPGAIQHAIFKDILSALRSIAGMNRRRNLGRT